MNSNQTANQVIQLINTFYNSRDTNEQAEANRRLTELQASQDVWDLCWFLLDSNKVIPTEARFYAAQVLLLKINQGWSQLDQEWLQKQLRPMLFETLVKYASLETAEKLVIDRLSLALANFALHSIPTFWPDAIENILQTFTPQNLPLTIPTQRICEILLKILMYIPEEYSVLMPQQDHRAQLNSQMTKSGLIVFKFLHSLLVTNNSDITYECRQNVLKCLTSWMLHSRTSLFELDDGKSILNYLYELIQDSELCGSACAALAASLSDGKAENYQKSIIEFMPKIAKLGQVIERYKSEEEIECIIKIYSLVINFAENHSRLFLKIVMQEGIKLDTDIENITRQAIFDIIRIILDSTAAPGTFGLDEKYSDISITFWFTFFENFCYYNDSFNDMICETFNPLVDSLLQTLITKAQYPTTVTYWQVWNDDQRESYRCYRQDLGDNISLIVHFPRARDRILAQLYERLNQEFAILLNAEPSNREKPWQSFESVIFALKSMSETVPYDESLYVEKILDILTGVPYSETHPLLYCTVAEMISAYSDWLYSHSSQLPKAYNILFLGINSPDTNVRLMSTLSLKDLTTECQNVLRPYAINIINSCIEAILRPNSSLSTNEKSRLMHATGTSLAVTTTETVISSLNTVTSPLISDLRTKIQSDPNVDPTCSLVILDRLTMLTSLIESLVVKESSGNDYEEDEENIFRELNSPNATVRVDVTQPTLTLLRELIPILNVIANKYRSDEEITGIISTTVKRSAKSLGVEVKPVLNELMTLIVSVYDPMTNSNILEGTLPLYSLFKEDPTLRDIFKQSFSMISDKTLKVCIGNPLRQLSVTIENFFRFSTAVCKRFSSFLTEPATTINFEYIYKLALASLELPEKRTLVEVSNFLSMYIQKSVGLVHLSRVFIDNLEDLVCKIFNIFGGTYSTPRNAIENISDLMFFVVQDANSKQFLKMVVDRVNFPTCHVNHEQKARFVSRIVHESNRRKFKDLCNEFVLIARNLNRSM